MSPQSLKLFRKFIRFVGATRPLTRMARPAKLPLQQQITTKVVIKNIAVVILGAAFIVVLLCTLVYLSVLFGRSLSTSTVKKGPVV